SASPSFLRFWRGQNVSSGHVGLAVFRAIFAQHAQKEREQVAFQLAIHLGFGASSYHHFRTFTSRDNVCQKHHLPTDMPWHFPIVPLILESQTRDILVHAANKFQLVALPVRGVIVKPTKRYASVLV